jgi:hypothetical protein
LETGKQQQQDLPPEQQHILAVLLQQLRAALAGNAAAMQLINSLTKYKGFDSWLLQHTEDIISVFAAEPWLQQQPAAEVQDVGKTVVFAANLLVRLLQHDKKAVAQSCTQLPPLWQRWLLDTDAKQQQQQQVRQQLTASAEDESVGALDCDATLCNVAAFLQLLLYRALHEVDSKDKADVHWLLLFSA